MNKLITIETKKYSSVVGAILDKYGKTARIRINNRILAASEIEKLRQTWCTNRSICQTHDFELQVNDKPLFGFHDHPRELWGAVSEQQFIEELRREGLVRYRAINIKEGFLKRIITRLTTRTS